MRTEVECPRFDGEKCILGVLCNKGSLSHQWGDTGKCLRQKRKDGTAGNCICCKRNWSVEELERVQYLRTQTDVERQQEQNARASASGELWKDVAGWEGLYEVSSWGRVRSLKNDMILKPNLNRNYHNVAFWAKGMEQSKRYSVHRLVAIAFISDPPTPQHQVNHIDGNPSNNRVENLEWTTPKENTRHAIEVLKINKINSGNFQPGSQHNASKMTEDNVKWILDNQSQLSRKEMAEEIGVSVALINDICLRRRWTHITSWYGLD